MNPTVIKQGWLEKKGEHLKFWSKRYLVLYDDGTLNGYKEQPSENDVLTLGGKLENRFTVKNVSIIRLDDGLNFKIRCRQQNPPSDNASIERSFRALSSGGKTDRDSWCDSIERICAENRSHRSSMGSTDMIIDQQNPDQSVESTDIDMPMVPELQQASRRLTMDSFARIKVLGQGSFGHVYLVYRKNDSTRRRMAMKVVKKKVVRESEESEHIQNERQVLGTTNHRFLIKLYHAFQTATQLCFVMEFAQGGEVYAMLAQKTKFPLNQCRFYGAEITCAFEYLHERQIIYRDLKLENILLADDGHIKVADFGLCKYLYNSDRTTQTFCGTPEYLAPEVIRDETYDDAVDWWSLGVVLHEMIVGRLPFSIDHSQNQEDLFDQIVDRRLPEFPAFVPVEARSLLQGLLHKDANHRLGGGERDALDVMEHPFFAPIDFEKLKRCEIEPPYVPNIRDQDDTNGFDRCFTQQPIDSYSALESYHGDDGDFPDFSYQNAETHHQEFSSVNEVDMAFTSVSS